MRACLKVLLGLEVVVCFGPMTLMLMIGAALIPIQILGLFIEEEHHWEGPVEGLGSVGCGLIGLWALLLLLSKLVDESQSQRIKSPWLVIAGAVIGAVPLIDPATSPSLVWRILAVMPMVSGIHLLLLGRKILFPPRGLEAQHSSARQPSRENPPRRDSAS